LKENELALLAFAFALIGLLFLYWLDANAKPDAASIAGLSAKDAGRFVQVSGTVEKAELKDGNWFFELCQESDCIKVVVFEGTARKMNGISLYEVKAGDFITVKGVVHEFNWQLEIVVSRPDGIQR